MAYRSAAFLVLLTLCACQKVPDSRAANDLPAKEESMPFATSSTRRPPIDAAAPAVFETATFALG